MWEDIEKEQLSRCGGGLSVLVVDQDTTALMYLASLLEQCSYDVTTTELASVAISMIRGGTRRFKLVIADINMDEENNLVLLRVSVTSKIPVILMSSERSRAFAQKVIGYGACLYLQKPISLNDVKYLWQHVYRRPRVSVAKREAYLRGLDQKGKKKKEVVPRDGGKDDRQMVAAVAGGEGEKDGAGGSKVKTPNREEEETRNGNENGVASDPDRPLGPKEKKSRLVWSKALHHKFEAAINALGDDEVRPMQILKMMNEPNLTHRQVASHLQKHKAQMKRMSGGSPNNLASNMNAYTSIFSKPGFLFMPQTPQVGLGPTVSVACLNQNQPWQQKLNFGLRFDPLSSMNRTLQFQSMLEPTGNLGNQIQNHIWSQPTRGADKSQIEMDSRAGAGAATVPEKWNSKQTDTLDDWLKVLDEETDDYVGSAIEPQPAEVDRFCELLKEAMLGNDQNP